MQIHADAEERHFYVPLINHDLTKDKARHSISEHHEINELIEKLEEMDFSSTGWLTTAKKLVEEVEHHWMKKSMRFFSLQEKPC